MSKYKKGESAYTDNSPFVRTLRTEGRVRLLAAMLVNPRKEHTVSRLMEKTGMARSTVLDNLDILKQMDLVRHTDRIGGANLYQLTDHDALSSLRQAQMSLLTKEQSRSKAPEPDKHSDQELPFGDSFGKPPEIRSEGIDQIDVDITN